MAYEFNAVVCRIIGARTKRRYISMQFVDEFFISLENDGKMMAYSVRTVESSRQFAAGLAAPTITACQSATQNMDLKLSNCSPRRQQKLGNDYSFFGLSFFWCAKYAPYWIDLRCESFSRDCVEQGKRTQ